MADIIRQEPQSLSTYLNLPPSPNESRMDLTEEIGLFRSTVARAAMAQQNAVAATCLTQIAALEKANLKLAVLADRVMSKQALRDIADRLVNILATAMGTAEDEALRQKLKEIINAQRNLASDYTDE